MGKRALEPELPQFLHAWERVDQTLSRLETLLLTLSLTGMVLMTVAQVVLRNVFSAGVQAFDPTVRHLLLVTVFMGAALATREQHHIHIDAFTKLFSGKKLHILHIGVAFVAALVCLVLLKGSWQFVQSTFQSGERIHSTFPTWIAQVVMPYGFFVMAMRFFKVGLTEVFRWSKGLPPPSELPTHGMVVPATEDM